jgi:hypothetical protein
MQNVFDLPSNLHITESYDLKGSTANRYIKPSQVAQSVLSSGRLPTFKDLNFRSTLCLNTNDRKALFVQLNKDTSFLATQHNIMDYSLLIGYADQLPSTTSSSTSLSSSNSGNGERHSTDRNHDHMQDHHAVLLRSVGRPAASSSASESCDFSTLVGINGSIGRKSMFQRYHGGLRSQVEENGSGAQVTLLNRIYYIAIIDTLQCYDVTKVAENFMKINILSPLGNLFFPGSNTSSPKKKIENNGGNGKMDEATTQCFIERPAKPKKLKSRGTKGYVGAVVGGYQVKCPFCSYLCFVDDQKVDQCFAQGIFGPISCQNVSGGNCLGKVCVGGEGVLVGGFDYVPNEFLNADVNISSIEPILYQKRFMEFVKERVLGNGVYQIYEMEERRRRLSSRQSSLSNDSMPMASSAVPIGGGGGTSSVPVAPLVCAPTVVPAVMPVLRTYRVTVPGGVLPGGHFVISAGGSNYTIVCPMNGGPGSTVEVQLPG